MPGTDTKLTPEIDEPTIPIATTHQGDFLFPRKKASLSVLFLPTSQEISKRNEKYTAIINKMKSPGILNEIFDSKTHKNS